MLANISRAKIAEGVFIAAPSFGLRDIKFRSCVFRMEWEQLTGNGTSLKS